jgi:hypothetical protein
MRSVFMHISKGSLMRLRFEVVAFPIVALSGFLLAGCGQSNEESLGGQTSQAVPHKEGTPDFKSYGEVQQYQTEQAAKNRGGAKTKPAPKS